MTAITPPSPRGSPEEGPGTVLGWYLGVAVVIGFLAVGLGLWFSHHP